MCKIEIVFFFNEIAIKQNKTHIVKSTAGMLYIYLFETCKKKKSHGKTLYFSRSADLIG